APLLLVDDVDWLTAEEFDHLHRGGGLEALIAGISATLEAVPEAAIVAAKRRLVERALRADLDAGDRRAAAFRAAEIARLDPPAARALIERLVDELQPGDDRRGIAWALAYALHKLGPSRERRALRGRLAARGGDFVAALLGELRGIEADEAADG
ncbi:MAG: hypothetical protein KC486_27605, partial [Myxococcales bacterium]|nr:hypothetical protein [Myxococcales bacterium]